MRVKTKMAEWFNPILLIQEAFRVFISTVFGQFADKRESIAAARPIADIRLDPKHDYSSAGEGGDFWFDYVADTGDGWNPTFAVARLLARDRWRLGGHDLPRGALLVMGGDQVYPSAGDREYRERLLGPYDEAWHPEGGAPLWPEGKGPDLYAVPGNHDWYDGLRAFLHFFCRRSVQGAGRAEVNRQGRAIGGRTTLQTRSYFALKLPGGWWLWGTDSQLEGYIDQPQVDFFDYVARHWMEDGSKLILCTGTPDWQYVDERAPEDGFSSFSYLARLAGSARKGHQVRLVLSGDSHHYARFREGDLDHVTCGGGGAFLHPTTQLRDRSFDFSFPPPNTPHDPDHGPWRREFRIAEKAEGGEALFPGRSECRRLSFGYLLFAFRNWKFWLTFAGLHFLFNWLLDYNSRLSAQQSLVEALSSGPLWQAVGRYWSLALFSPFTILLCLLGTAAYCYFAECRGWRRILLGIGHAGLQAILISIVTCLVVQLLAQAWPGMVEAAGQAARPSGAAAASGGWTMATACGLGLKLLALAIASLVSALAAATLIGLYLWACLALWGIHWGHFSALAVEDYKSFLRLRIDREGNLTLFPIGLRKVPDDRRRRDGDPPEDIVPELIETPIRIV
jgi:hypothetical protein